MYSTFALIRLNHRVTLSALLVCLAQRPDSREAVYHQATLQEGVYAVTVSISFEKKTPPPKKKKKEEEEEEESNY